MKKEYKLLKIQSFLKDHLGIDIDLKALDSFLNNEKFIAFLKDSMRSYQKEDRQYGEMDHGYSNRDDYYRFIPKKTIPGYTDSEGRKITHQVMFKEAAEELREKFPNIHIEATRTGLEISYPQTPSELNNIFFKTNPFKKL